VSEDRHVIVVGAALGGAAAALLLARAGARVTLLEKVAEPRAVGAGIAVAENGLVVLESLGLGDELARLATRVGSISVVDGRSRPLLTPRGPQPRLVMVRRSELARLLLAAVAAEPRIELRLGADVLGAEREGTVLVRGRGGIERLRGDLVVGADGVHSNVRESADFGAVVRRTGVRYVRLLAPPGLARGEEAWTRQGLFGSVALPDATYAYASAQGPAAHLVGTPGGLERWKDEWSRAYEPARAIFAGVTGWHELLLNEVVRVDCERYFVGRLALLGDAAHAMAPNVGQGGNSALVDAAVLASALRETGDVAAALARYDARRRPAVRKVADTADRLGALAHWTNPIAAFVRNELLLPIAERFTGRKAMSTVLQESAADLARMCAVPTPAEQLA
jgi:2-polyprenyl-6-methoxyphenol hydroxylase-like FAD-dependent oxidoreductase